MTKYQILTLNQISSHGLHRFPNARYAVGKAVDQPDAILVRSPEPGAPCEGAILQRCKNLDAIGRPGR